jgi:hypothetical protein
MHLNGAQGKGFRAGEPSRTLGAGWDTATTTSILSSVQFVTPFTPLVAVLQVQILKICHVILAWDQQKVIILPSSFNVTASSLRTLYM